jgi:predicted alpha/beta hydrolase family esterase
LRPAAAVAVDMPQITITLLNKCRKFAGRDVVRSAVARDAWSERQTGAPMQLLIIPGLGGSGPTHWQSHWERSFPGARRVEQSDWNRPVLAQWLEPLAAAVRSAPGAILVGHSLGCALIAHLAWRRPELRIGGALLVAPADVDRPGCVLPQVEDFAPMPTGILPFRAVVVGSMNDPYMTIERARFLAKAWGAGLVNAGACGHINATAGFGPWLAGEKILADLVGECKLRARIKEADHLPAFVASGAVPGSIYRPARPSWLFRAQDDQP